MIISCSAGPNYKSLPGISDPYLLALEAENLLLSTMENNAWEKYISSCAENVRLFSVPTTTSQLGDSVYYNIGVLRSGKIPPRYTIKSGRIRLVEGDAARMQVSSDDLKDSNPTVEVTIVKIDGEVVVDEIEILDGFHVKTIK